MKIAICDCDISSVKNLKRIIYTYADHFRMEIVIDWYASGEELLKSETHYSIVFLEYKLKGICGLEVAQRMKSINPYISVVFISGHTEFVFDSFKVNPYRFLVKPIKESDIFEMLDDFFKKMGSDYSLWIKCGEDTVCMNTGEIYYLEANNKNCIIHLRDSRLKCNRTMAYVFNEMPNHFSKINRAYVINLNFIEKYNNKEICLKNKEVLHIGRSFLKSFKDEYRHLSQPIEI